ncbi:MAG: LOG family protein [Alphaproteobacteria bacterium]|nr:LOG family protein [Alphaproteobacteria bacterium]
MTFAEDLQKQGITVLKTIPEKAEGEVRMTVFCGSAYGNMPIFREIAEDMGKYCAENNLTVMCGGGRFGMMGALIRSTLENGGKVVAASAEDVWKVESEAGFVTPETGELYNYLLPEYKSQLSFVMAESLQERQDMLVECADMYCALPGSRGTMFEFLQAIVQKSVSHSKKQIILVSPENLEYWQPLLDQFKVAFKYGFAKDDASHLFDVVDNVRKIAEINKK